MEILLSAFLFFLPLQEGTKTILTNKNVRFEISLKSSTLKPGRTGEIVLYLTPVEGIHINTEPAIVFELDQLPRVTFLGISDLPKDAATSYLIPSKPVRYKFTVDKKITPGKYVLRGKVNYFFCSDAEGWCNRFVQPIELTFSVVQ